MRPAIPWLSSLLLHVLLLSGLVILTSTPPKIPLRLTLDFQLIASQLIMEVEPEPLAKAPPPVETLKERPTPVPEIRPAKPELIPAPAPVLEPSSEAELPEPEPEVVSVAPAPVMQTNTLSVRDMELERIERQTRTVNFIRGEVLRKLNYPTIARRQGWKGSLVLSFILCTDGSVENLEVLESSGHKVLDRAALKAVVANAPFNGGYPRTQVNLPITFQLN